MNQIKVSYHGGHSGDFCDHASDTKRELVEAYLTNGFTHVGMTEHMPPHRDEFLYDDEKEKGHDAHFLTARFDRYFAEVRAELQRVFGDKLHLLFGFETEFYGQKPLSRIKGVIDRYNPDLVVASVHHVHDIPIDYGPEEYHQAINTLGGLDALYSAYYDHQLDLIRALPRFMPNRPVIVGHFDLIKIFSPDHRPSEEVNEKVARNIAVAVKNGCIFEVNARAFKKGISEPYPSTFILQLIKEAGGEITLGDDSHAADQVGLHYDKTGPIVERFFNHIVAFEKEGETINKVFLSIQ